MKRNPRRLQADLSVLPLKFAFNMHNLEIFASNQKNMKIFGKCRQEIHGDFWISILALVFNLT